MMGLLPHVPSQHNRQQMMVPEAGPSQNMPGVRYMCYRPLSLIRVHAYLSCSLCKCNYVVQKDVKKSWKEALREMLQQGKLKSQ